MDENKSCQCDQCQSACTHRPGWYMPGEAEQTAALLGMTLKEFFDQYLAVDYYIGGDSNIYLLMPATNRCEAGEVVPFDPCGRCVFFNTKRCSVHEAKPFECREYMHSDDRQTVNERHKAVAEAWNTPEHQAQITELLGHAPQADYDMGDVLSLLLSE